MTASWRARGILGVVLAGAGLLLGGCGPRAGEEEGGARDAKESLWSEPAPSPISRYDQAKRLYERGRYEEAVAALEKWLHDYPKNPLEPAALYYLARSQFAVGGRSDAAATFERIEKDYAKTDWATFARQDMVGLRGEAVRAAVHRRRWWHPVDWLTPDPPPVRDFEAARMHYRHRRYSQALAAFRTLAERDPKSPLAPASWYFAGRCYEQLGEVDKAREAFQHIVATYAQTDWEWLAQEDLRRLKPE